MICDGGLFTIKYLASVIDTIIIRLLRSQTVKGRSVYIAIIEEITVKVLIIHPLLLDINHLDREYKDLRSNIFLTFLC